MLRLLGQNVTTACNGREALACGRQQLFDLVLMDVCMPEMDGLTCTRQWRQDSQNQDTECAIMALSANTASEEIVRCKQAGMHHYLSKPVTLAHLADGISIAAEYQLQREIDLQEQNSRMDKAIIDITPPRCDEKSVVHFANCYQALNKIQAIRKKLSRCWIP